MDRGQGNMYKRAALQYGTEDGRDRVACNSVKE